MHTRPLLSLLQCISPSSSFPGLPEVWSEETVKAWALLAWATCREQEGQAGRGKYPWRNSLRWGRGGEVSKRIRSHGIWWEREFLGQVNINVMLQRGQRERNLEKKPLSWVTDSSQQIFPNSLPGSLLAVRDTKMTRSPLITSKRSGTERADFRGRGRWWDNRNSKSKLFV